MTTFKFMKLPYLARRLAVKLMGTNEQINFSLISRNSKRLVQCVTKTPDYFEATIQGQIICLDTNLEDMKHLKLVFLPELRLGSCPVPTTPLVVKSAISCRGCELEKAEFSTRDWINHLVDIFHCKTLKLTFDQGSAYYNLVSIRDLFQGFDIIGLAIQDTYREHALKILWIFQPVLSIIHQLSIIRVPFELEDMEYIHGVVFQNYDYLKLAGPSDLGIEAVMDMNSKIIEMSNPEIDAFQLNLFVQEWMNITTSASMETLTILLQKQETVEFYEHVILDEIPHTVVPRDRFKKFRMPIDTNSWKKMDRIVGQYEIQGWEERKATIQLDVYGNEVRFKFVVGQ
ncbi:hypothetical protein CRE_02373 [Caenorhabditis remanei]|uniref:Sdz-33 F-box domain-containing protein n=1 Tax=Caenorhabditis remanei TaxID=31234 RepID=E3MIU9_CAERE|nr:hypothetical protein CRE_02373 [Caenorhabditis remanei]